MMIGPFYTHKKQYLRQAQLLNFSSFTQLLLSSHSTPLSISYKLVLPLSKEKVYITPNVLGGSLHTPNIQNQFSSTPNY